MRATRLSIMAVLLLFVPGFAADAVNSTRAVPKKPDANKPDEATAKAVSFEKAAAFLDGTSAAWCAERKCVTCHTNMAYLMARPLLKDVPNDAEPEVRGFFEKQVAGWEDPVKPVEPRGPAYVVATAAGLALHDAKGTGKLHDLTRKALDRMWAVQQKDGAWKWLKCDWPPLEHDDYYGAVLAAVAVGQAPGGYADTEKAKAGLAKLREYLSKNPAPNLHHKMWLLWASVKIDGLMTRPEQEAAIKEVLKAQQADGGWSLASLGDWKGFDGRKNNPEAPSDGYGTGLAVFILREAGVESDKEAIKKGVAWLKANQRESGRWFTQSLNTDKAHYISHTGTAFAVLALKACQAAR